jgi:hypothetical protein
LEKTFVAKKFASQAYIAAHAPRRPAGGGPAATIPKIGRRHL